MPQLNLKPNHKAVRDYYATLQQYEQHDITHEGAGSNPFAFLLDTCAKQINGTLVPQYPMRAPKGNRIVIDGTVLNEIGLPQKWLNTNFVGVRYALSNLQDR